MSIKGFSVNGVVQRYDYTALDNLPQGQGVSDDLKAALLQLAQKVAYIDDQGQTYYDDLYDALYPEKTLLSIAANFQQGQAVVYNTDSLDSLKQYLTVTATYDDASTETVPSSAYTLSGTLTTGTSVITVTYEGKTDAFNVTVTAAPMSFAVTNTLTGCTTSNSATSVLENTSYTAVITASSGYTLVGATVSITMGGNDITTSAYSGGIITINSVTGALVISVAAVAAVLNSITATYTQSGTVYDTDTLDSLKDDLVVTANYSDSSTQTVPAADYTLSGTLTAGTSTITVSYSGKTTTFNVTVTAWTLTWSYLDGGLPNVVAPNDWNATHTGQASHASFVDGIGIKWTGKGGGETYTLKNYATTSEGTMEIVVNFPEESEALNVRATLNTASDTLIGFIFRQGIKVNGSGSDYSFIPNTSVVLGTDNTLRVVRTNNIGKVYLNGVMVYSGELRTLSGTNNVLISPSDNMTQERTVYVKAIRFKHLQ